MSAEQGYRGCSIRLREGIEALTPTPTISCAMFPHPTPRPTRAAGARPDRATACSVLEARQRAAPRAIARRRCLPNRAGSHGRAGLRYRGGRARCGHRRLDRRQHDGIAPAGLRSRFRDESGGLSGQPLLVRRISVWLRCIVIPRPHSDHRLWRVSSGADATLRSGRSEPRAAVFALVFQGPGLLQAVKDDLAQRLKAMATQAWLMP